jgi:tRNA threonylcarbamoyladenosine dehydratase
MNTINAPEFSRNYGFWNEDEQQAIMDSHVAIGGVGGDGFELGLRLARMGVANFTVADPEVFEPENVNRVPGATSDTINRKKVDVFAEEVRRINPDANVRTFDEGINEDNIADFVDGATITFDETELTRPELGTMLAREARKRGIPNVLVMNVGFAALVTSFHPEKGKTFEDFMGLSNEAPLSEIAKQKIDFSRCLPYLPSYIDMNSFKAVVEDNAPLPSIVHGVGIASAMGAAEGFKHMTSGVNNHRPSPVWAPRVQWMDSLTGESGTTRFPRLSHYRHIAGMVVKNMLGRHSQADYSTESRDRRTDAYKAEQAAAPQARPQAEPHRGRHARD